MARSLNKVTLIGNLTRDPELRYTPQGHAICTFGIATNRDWVSDGEKHEEAEFHNVVAWNKLAEICDQLLGKGDKAFVEGRLQTRSWDDDDGKKNYKTEIVIDEMILLNSKSGAASSYSNTEDVDYENLNEDSEEETKEEDNKESEDVDAEEIPF